MVMTNYTTRRAFEYDQAVPRAVPGVSRLSASRDQRGIQVYLQTVLQRTTSHLPTSVESVSPDPRNHPQVRLKSEGVCVQSMPSIADPLFDSSRLVHVQSCCSPAGELAQLQRPVRLELRLSLKPPANALIYPRR